MSRKPRIHYPGALYHVILRGNAGQPVFSDNADRYRFYLLLQEGTCRFGYRVHAFCLMGNHIHLVLQVGNLPLAKGMHNLSFRFTRWMNFRESRTGHLFQGRYKAILVDADAYLLQLVRYIHFNPERAAMVEKPSDYCWSSHRAYLGIELIPWLTTDLVLGQFHNNLPQARDAYLSFMAEGADEGKRQEFYTGNYEGRILGDDRFADEALAQAEEGPCTRINVELLKELVLREFGTTMPELRTRSQKRSLSLSRAVMAWLVVQTAATTLTEVGNWFNRDVVTMSTAVRRLGERAERGTELREVMERILVEVSRTEA